MQWPFIRKKRQVGCAAAVAGGRGFWEGRSGWEHSDGRSMQPEVGPEAHTAAREQLAGIS